MSATILNLYRLLDELETMFFPMADDKRLRLVFERGPEVPQYVRADEIKLRQVLTNLLSIALEATSEGSVALRTDIAVQSAPSSTGLWLSFILEDTGPGMAAQDVKELSGSSAPGVAGQHAPEYRDLALAISIKYVQLLGGTLNIESQVGHGTTVAFDLPMDPIEPNRDAAHADQKSRSVLGLAQGQPNWRVLVADDRRAARLLLVRLLAPIGFDVRQAGDGQEVIDTWQAWQPHLILMDLGMLTMDGREAAQRIKASSEGRAPTIIALAASSFKQPRRALLQAGCDDFLCKPFEDGDLYEMLRKQLGVQYVYADEPVGILTSDAGSGAVSPAEPMPRVSDRNRKGIRGTKGTIMIVDDSPALLESLISLLIDQGYTVHAFLDGKLALKFVESTLPDLVLLDVLMPGMDGYQVCRHLKARERTRDIPIIFLTVMTETLDKVQGFRLGAVDYIARPFESEEVLARVATHLALRRQQKQLDAKNIQIQESEELHRLTLSSISDAVFLTDDSGAFKFICPNVNTIFGYSVQEVQALSNISKLLGGDLFVPAELQTLSEIQNIERTITDQSGKPHALLVNVKQVSIREGTQLYTCRDITERKRVEEALHESEVRYRELWKQTQAALTKTEALYRVNRSLIATVDMPGLLQAVAERVAEDLPANRVGVFTTELTQRQVIHAVKGGPGKNYVVDIDFDELWEGLGGWVLREGKPALSPKTSPDPRESPQVQRRRVETNRGSTIVVPLVYQYTILGFIAAVNLPEERDYTQEDLQLMIAIASQAAIAIQNARLYEELQSSYDEMEQRVEARTAELAQANATLKTEISEHRMAEEALRKRLEDIAILHALATACAESTSEDELIVRALRVMSRSADKTKVGLWLVDELTGTLRAFQSSRASQDDVGAVHTTVPLEQGLAGQVAADGRPRHIADRTQGELSFQAHSDTLSIFCVAMKVDERVIGVIQAESALADAFVEADEHLLSTCAEQLATAVEKIRLFQAEAQRRQESETLRQVASVISASTDRSAVMGLILDQLKTVVPYDSASVMLVSGDRLALAAQRGLQPEKPLPAPVQLETYPHLGQILEHRQPVLIADTFADTRWQGSSHNDHIRCWLGVPLVIRDKVIGLLNVDKAQPGFYTERDASMVMAFADHAGIALENARLFDQIIRRAQDLEALEAISSGLRQAGTREAMLQFIVKKSVEALGGDAAALLQFERGMLVLKAEYGRITGLLGLPHSPVDCEHWKAVRAGEPLYTTDEAGQNRSSCQCGICGAMMRDMAVGVVIPLKTSEETVGLLHLVFGSRREFSAEKRRMLATIAEITGSALHRAGILETLEQRVADRTRELAALYEVTAVSSGALDQQNMLERSLERVLKAMRSSTATIHLLNEMGETLILAAYQTIAPEGPAEIDFSTPAPHIKEWLIGRGEPLVISDMTSGSQTSSAADVSNAYTYAGAPMRVGGQRLGILGVARAANQQFSIEEVALLASIADQVAVAVENARLRQKAEKMAIVEERARLARELHDSVTQCLSSVTLLAQAASDFSEVGEWGRVKHYMERIRDTGGQALKEMRLLLYELQPPSTAQEDLVEMLTRRLDAVEERAGVSVWLQTEDWLRLPAAAEEALYRIAQEALNNALKHSNASMVTINLRRDPDGATLEVNDNGTGFDPDSVKRKGGIGLLSMQQRAERLGGGLAIRSAPGEGTSIKVSLDGF